MYGQYDGGRLRFPALTILIWLFMFIPLGLTSFRSTAPSFRVLRQGTRHDGALGGTGGTAGARRLVVQPTDHLVATMFPAEIVGSRVPGPEELRSPKLAEIAKCATSSQ